MIVKIKTNNTHIKEKKYILSVLFIDILKLKIEYEYTSENIFEIILPNNKKIVIPDIFFDSYKNEKKWEKFHFPNQSFDTIITIKNLHNLFGIYGEKGLVMNDKSIFINNDIIGTAFVFLSRIEELNPNQDEFGRYQYKNSLAEKFNLITRPVVNEYIEFLKESIQFLCPDIKFAKQKFNILLSHDIDTIKKWTFKHLIKHSISNLGKPNFFKGYIDFIKSKFDYTIDPYYNFKKIMKMSNNYGLQSIFLFMALKKNDFDFRYPLKKAITAFEQIKSTKKHKIGIHISRIAYNNFDNASVEIKRLKDITKTEIEYSRQHYLMFDVKSTWSILNEHNIKYDLSLGYPEMPGFRCGICYPYYVFDIINKKKLDLIEIPLIIMDVSILDYLKDINFDDQLEKILKNTKKYNGTLNILWHNDQIDNLKLQQNKILFEKIIKS